MWVVLILGIVGIVAAQIWTSRKKDREQRDATKQLVEARINLCLMAYGTFAGLDAPETARLLALRVAVRQGQLLPLARYSTNEQADLWVDQQLNLMSLADPQKVENLAAPEREALRTAMVRDPNPVLNDDKTKIPLTADSALALAKNLTDPRYYQPLIDAGVVTASDLAHLWAAETPEEAAKRFFDLLAAVGTRDDQKR